MRADGTWTALVALVLLFSGCSGAGKGSSAASGHPSSSIDVTSGKTGEKGDLRGVVRDDERNPLKGAHVGLVQLSNAVVSDGNGSFAFLGVPAGRYTVAASLLGYHDTAKSVEIVAGQNATADLTLAKLAVVAAYNQTYIYQGHIMCGTLLVPFCGEEQDAGGPNPTNDIYHWEWDYTPASIPVQEILELVWTPTTASTGQHLDPLYSTSDPNDTTGLSSKTIYSDEGKSPMRHVVDGTELLAAYNAFKSSQFSYGVYPPAAEVVVDQKFTLYRTVFYGEASPKDFTAIPK